MVPYVIESHQVVIPVLQYDSLHWRRVPNWAGLGPYGPSFEHVAGALVPFLHL